MTFPKRYEDSQSSSGASPLLQQQGKSLLKEIVSTHAPSKSFSLDATSRPGEDHNAIKDNFKYLADVIERCSSRIFYDLKARLKTDRTFFDATGVPGEVLTGSALKSGVAGGLRGATGWNSRARVAVVRLLRSYDRSILLAQIGAVAEVCVVSSSRLWLAQFCDMHGICVRAVCGSLHFRMLTMLYFPVHWQCIPVKQPLVYIEDW